jgi:hypothetical protein
VRQWNDKFVQRLLQALTDTFPSYEVVLFNDRNETLMACMECQIKLFSEADGKALLVVYFVPMVNYLII